MAVHIRLMRMGKKRRPYYRVVVSDQRNQRDGAFLDQIGVYQPVEGDGVTRLDLDKYNEWISKGAQPTPTVKQLVRQEKRKSAQ